VQLGRFGPSGYYALGHVGDVGHLLLAVQLGDLDQGCCNCSVSSAAIAAIVASKQRVLAIKDYGPYLALDEVGVHLDRSVTKKHHKARPLPQGTCRMASAKLDAAETRPSWSCS